MLLYFAEGIILAAFFAYIFYRSIMAFFILLPAIVLFFKKKRRELMRKRKTIITLQFRELMRSVISGLYAGYSVENAFIYAYRDMVMLFGKNALISKELTTMVRKLKNNVSLEELLEDLGMRSHVKDIKDFAEVFRIAKRSGGDMPAIMRQTENIISEKIEASRKIETVISSKKFEQKIMNFMPFGIILYIDVTSPGFFDLLYHNTKGILIMTMMAVIYLAAYFLAERITDIKV